MSLALQTVPYLGSSLQLVPQPDRKRPHRVGEQLLTPPRISHELLERWYRRSARNEITLRLDAITRTLDVRYRKLQIRNQRTRWASCSPDTGTLSFNWRLLLAPLEILEYVIWHEVCHLLIPNHSRAFWQLVERHCPDYRTHTRWLREHGPTLDLVAMLS